MKYKSFFNKAIGVILFLIGGFLMVAGTRFNRTFDDFPIPMGGWWTLLYAAVALIGLILLSLGRKQGQEDAETVLSRSNKKPVLYLRPFDLDEDQSYKFSRLGFQVSANVELDIAGATKKVGPLIARGNPAYGLPTLGAAKFFVDDDEWQGKFREYVDKAQIIILSLGFSEEIMWELHELLKIEELEKVIIHVPFQGNKEYSKEQQWFFLDSK